MKAWLILRQPRWLLVIAAVLLLAAYLLFSDQAPETPLEVASPAVPPGLPKPPRLPGGEAAPSPEPPVAAASSGATDAPPAGPADIFAVRTWEPPAPPPEVAADLPPPVPQAPPVPFRFIGKLEERGKPVVYFLSEGEQILVVSPGDLIKGNYRVGKIEGGELHFLYRPMNLKQSIPAGGDT